MTKLAILAILHENEFLANMSFMSLISLKDENTNFFDIDPSDSLKIPMAERRTNLVYLILYVS